MEDVASDICPVDIARHVTGCRLTHETRVQSVGGRGEQYPVGPKCGDRKTQGYCAIKIIRNVQKYRDAAMIEVCDLAFGFCMWDVLGERCMRGVCGVYVGSMRGA